MTLIELLEKTKDNIVSESMQAISRSFGADGSKLYSSGREETTKQKMEALYDVIHQSIKEKILIPIVTYIEKTAEKRYQSGFELQEVQIAINILEENIWKHILDELPKEDQPKALSLVSSIIGSGKDTLARTYVTLTQEQTKEDKPESEKAEVK